MALAFKHRGVLVPKQNLQAPSLWDEIRQRSNLQSGLCLPKQRFEQGPILSYDPYASIDQQSADNNSHGSMMALSYRHCDVTQDFQQDLQSQKANIARNCRFFSK